MIDGVYYLHVSFLVASTYIFKQNGSIRSNSIGVSSHDAIVRMLVWLIVIYLYSMNYTFPIPHLRPIWIRITKQFPFDTTLSSAMCHHMAKLSDMTRRHVQRTSQATSQLDARLNSTIEYILMGVVFYGRKHGWSCGQTQNMIPNNHQHLEIIQHNPKQPKTRWGVKQPYTC